MGDWLQENGKTPAKFADEIGVAKSTVGRWVDPTIKVMPHRDHLQLIGAATRGAVTAHDFIDATSPLTSERVPEGNEVRQENNRETVV